MWYGKIWKEGRGGNEDKKRGKEELREGTKT